MLNCQYVQLSVFCLVVSFLLSLVFCSVFSILLSCQYFTHYCRRHPLNLSFLLQQWIFHDQTQNVKRLKIQISSGKLFFVYLLSKYFFPWGCLFGQKFGFCMNECCYVSDSIILSQPKAFQLITLDILGAVSYYSIVSVIHDHTEYWVQCTSIHRILYPRVFRYYVVTSYVSYVCTKQKKYFP